MNQFEFNGAFVVELPVGQFTSLAIKMAGYSTPMIPSIKAVLRARADTVEASSQKFEKLDEYLR